MQMTQHDRHDWDLVIVGASFAGAACAIAAAQYGLRVCVMERKRDPGLKLHTTGIIVKEAAENTWLARLPPDLLHRVERVRLYAPSLRSLSLQSPGYYFLTTDTPNVMRWLADEMRAQGVDVRLMQSFTDAQRLDGDERDAGWRIARLGTARYLVGADGAKSRVAQRVGLPAVGDYLYGIEHEFPGLQLHEPDALHCFVSKRLAPGYIGWAAQNPCGVQLGLAFRHGRTRLGVPDIDALRAIVGERIGIPIDAMPAATRAGLIPCGGALANLSAPGVILTGDAAGIVSPVTAGGIHSAWAHGWKTGEAIARHLRHGGPLPEQVAQQATPRYRVKRALRWAFDRWQMDWPFDLFLHTPPLRWAAKQVYFHNA